MNRSRWLQGLLWAESRIMRDDGKIKIEELETMEKYIFLTTEHSFERGILDYIRNARIRIDEGFFVSE